ncbi:hypothetical protein SAMD00023353_2001470 [Rosellinia necatrix]|uniref:DNA/RNA-binding domain-containing protein n=1 Tax=Rosellinia necatrix TaxID=77044 RepID=A0A1W2TEY8_ROSNE|nr:hypothetical protein SAMD00023353_2001470 [Rosellinia necatrix]
MADNKDPPITKNFISHLRQASKSSCPVPGCNDTFPTVDRKIIDHLKANHLSYIEGKDLEALIRDIKRGRVPVAGAVETPGPGGGLSSSINQPRASSASPPRRSRARRPQDAEFTPRAPQQGKLWTPEDGSSPNPHIARHLPAKQAGPPILPRGGGPQDEADEEENEESLRPIKPPETRPISQDQLVAEVKGIYAGLMMVESKCIEVDNAQSSQSGTELNNEQWQALIALHRTLLHEHHDFFLASQHPSANSAIKRLASKYAMPARMWRHGIHSFLELLRHRLPGSLEHMLTFIYLAYSMMALLYETVPAFEDTWIECLGDLGRYRMAIEDEDIRDREVWTSVSRQWYSKASDKAPTTGRLYHHLAILARPNALQQLYYYTKSLCVPIPFQSAKESIMTLFDPILGVGSYQHAHLPHVDIAFVKTHGILFTHKQPGKFQQVVAEFLGSLDSHINGIGKGWLEAGYYIAIANCCALLSYGKEENPIMASIRNQTDEQRIQDISPGIHPSRQSKHFEDALHLVMGTHEVVLSRRDDENVLPYIHITMVFMSYLTRFPAALGQFERRFPWKLFSLMLNEFLNLSTDLNRICSNDFPRENNTPPRPLPEDFALKGLLFVDQYHPEDWFSNEKIDDDEKYFEKASMAGVRRERILWLSYKIAQAGRGLTYNEGANQFGVLPEYEEDTDMTNIGDTSATTTSLQTTTRDAMDIDETPVTTPSMRIP